MIPSIEVTIQHRVASRFDFYRVWLRNYVCDDRYILARLDTLEQVRAFCDYHNLTIIDYRKNYNSVKLEEL
jgi:hypothetical protein